MILNLGKHHQGLEPYNTFSNDDPRLTLTSFTSRSKLLHNAFEWENAKTVDFIETIEVYEVKVGTNSWLTEYMDTYDTKGQGHCLTFVQGHADLYFQRPSAPKLLATSKPNFI